MANAAIGKPGLEKFWVPGDWNAYFGFGANVLVNVLVLTGLLRFVLKMPNSLVFRPNSSRAWADAVPQHGLLRVAGLWAPRKKTGRTDVCALPSGAGVPHMFVVTFVVMLPILLGPRIRSRRGEQASPRCSSRASS